MINPVAGLVTVERLVILGSKTPFVVLVTSSAVLESGVVVLMPTYAVIALHAITEINKINLFIPK